MVPPGKYLAGGLQSDCTANLTGVQYKFPISDFLNLGDSYFPFGGYWGNKILPPIFLTFNISLPITSL